MRLLLDEMYTPTMAAGLRARGHDAVAVVERPELRRLADPALFAAAQDERRVLVTENLDDFVRVANEWDARRDAHHGLVLVPATKYHRGAARTIGAMVTALDALAGRLANEPRSARIWL